MDMTIVSTLLGVLLLAFPLYAFYLSGARLVRQSVMALCRMLVQVSLTGCLVWALDVVNHWSLGVAALLLLSLFAAWMTARRGRLRRTKMLLPLWLCLFVASLATSLYLQSQGIIVGAVAPVAVRTQTGTPMSYKLVYLSDYNEHIMQVIQTMNSMSLIKLSLFDKVGLMDESLFIDGVDSEWCWRATKLVGATFYYDRNIQMTHQLGIATNKLLNREISIASPTRLYYQYRNYLWLMRRDYVPRQWLVRHGVKYFIKIFYYTIKGPNRRSYIKNIYNGIKAGIKNCP
jgi:hypothetical protein